MAAGTLGHVRVSDNHQRPDLLSPIICTLSLHAGTDISHIPSVFESREYINISAVFTDTSSLVHSPGDPGERAQELSAIELQDE